MEQSVKTETIYHDQSTNHFYSIDGGTTYSTRYYAVEDNNKFTSGLLRASISSGTKAHATEIIEYIDGVLKNPHTRSYYAKSGDYLLQISVREDESGERYLHYVTATKTISKEEYENTLSDLNSRFSKEGFLPYLTEQLSEEFPSKLTLSEMLDKDFQTEENKSFKFNDDLMLSPIGRKYSISDKNGYVFAGDSYMFTKSQDGLKVYKCDYDFFENTLTVHSEEKLTEKEKEKIQEHGYDITK